MVVPEGIDLSWAVLIFLGTLCVGVFLASWKIFSVRNADHVKIATDLAKVKSDLKKLIADNHKDHTDAIESKYTILDDRITRNREDLVDKIEGKCESIKKEIDRNDRDNEDQYKELHGRMNRGTDELATVSGDMREVRGELKVISTLVIDNNKKGRGDS